MGRAEKETAIDDLSKCFTRAQVAIFMDFSGLTVADNTQLRKELRSVGCSSKVVKNTLGRLSIKNAYKVGFDSEEVKKLVEILTGPNLVTFGYTDMVAPAKVIAKFAKTHDKLKVKGAWLDGKSLNAAGVDALSKMPGREELLSQLLALLNTPATQLLRVIQAPAQQMARLLNAHKEKIEGK